MTQDRDWESERRIIEDHASTERIALIAQSFAKLTGTNLIPDDAEPLSALWNMPAALLAHGTEADPIFFYANRMTLELFEFPADEFIRLPSRLSAEPLAREERSRLLEQVSHKGFISDYSGVRISQTGNRFRIEQAIVWNLAKNASDIHGQAACFKSWTPLLAG